MLHAASVHQNWLKFWMSHTTMDQCEASSLLSAYLILHQQRNWLKKVYTREPESNCPVEIISTDQNSEDTDQETLTTDQCEVPKPSDTRMSLWSLSTLLTTELWLADSQLCRPIRGEQEKGNRLPQWDRETTHGPMDTPRLLFVSLWGHTAGWCPEVDPHLESMKETCRFQNKELICLHTRAHTPHTHTRAPRHAHTHTHALYNTLRDTRSEGPDGFLVPADIWISAALSHSSLIGSDRFPLCGFLGLCVFRSVWQDFSQQNQKVLTYLVT